MSVTFPGTARIEFDWEYPEPPDIVYKLAQLENYLENTVVLAELAKEELRADMRMKFETETDPGGHGWQELEKPEAQQIGILRRGSTSAQMYHDVISESAWKTSPVGVFLDTGALPPYWAFHEQPEGFGGQRIPARQFIDASGEAQAVITAKGEGWLAAGVEGSVIGGVFRRQVRSPATGRFVSTRPEFYSQ